MVRRVAGRPRRPEPTPAAPEHTPAAAEAAPAPAEAAPAAVARPAAPLEGEPVLLVVGRIGKPQGLRGEVTVEVRTDEPDARFADGSTLLTEPADRGPLTVEGSRYQNGRLVVAFARVPDRTAAEALRDTLLLVDAATLPVPEDPDVFLDVHLVGLRAELEDGSPVGVVHEVLHLPHGDVLAVRRDDARPGAAEVLVPFVAAMVPVVDVAGRRLVLAPPEGLLDLSEPAPEPVAETVPGIPAEEDPAQPGQA